MSSVPQIEKDVHALQIQVAKIEGRLEPKKDANWLRTIALSILGTASLGWIVWVSASLWTIKQSLADGGSKALVSALGKPASPEQLRANFTSVVASIQTAQAAMKKPNYAKTFALSKAVASAIQKDPSMDEGWRAASELITYRTVDYERPILPRCDFHSVIIQSDDRGRLTVVVRVNACTFDLSTDAASLDVAFNSGIKGNISRAYRLEAEGALVTYRGGSLSTLAQTYVLQHCTLNFQTESRPPQNGARISVALLQSEDLGDVTVGV